jgi:hypothetical protein
MLKRLFLTSFQTAAESICLLQACQSENVHVRFLSTTLKSSRLFLDGASVHHDVSKGSQIPVSTTGSSTHSHIPSRGERDSKPLRHRNKNEPMPTWLNILIRKRKYVFTDDKGHAGVYHHEQSLR